MKDPIRRTMSKRAWKLQDFPAHAANVNSVSLGHKSGRVLVTGGNDKKVNLWAVGKPNCIMSLSGHSTPVDCVRFSISEEHVCAGSQAGALKIWDLGSAKMTRTLTGHRSSIRTVDFHPYGDFLASGSQDCGIKMWDIRKKGCIFGYKGHNSAVNSLKFSPDGQWIASGGDDNLVKIWDIRVGKVLGEFRGHGGSVSAVEFHPEEFILASGSADRTVKFWDLESFSLISTSTPDVPSVRCISFHPNGSCLFAASPDALRVHGWEPSEVIDSVPTSWLKIQDIAIQAQEQLIGVTTQMTNVSIFVVDLRRVQPIGKSSRDRAPIHTGHSLRKNFNTARSTEFEDSLHAMKINDDSAVRSATEMEDDSFTQDSEIEPSNFEQVFHPHRDLNRTPPPEDFMPPTDEEPSSSLSHSTGTDPESPRPEPPSKKGVTRFKFVTTRTVRKDESPDSPRRGSVPSVTTTPASLSPPRYSQSHMNRSRSPDFLYGRQNSFSDDSSSSGPPSSRSMETTRLPPVYHQQQTIQAPPRGMKHSPSESSLSSVSNHGRGGGDQRSGGGSTPYSKRNNSIPRSPERSLAQSQNKSMLKAPPVASEPLRNNYNSSKTDFSDEFSKNKIQMDDFVPISMDKPSGLAIDDFLPKKAQFAFQGGVHNLDIDESSLFINMYKEHQQILSVLSTRQRNLRFIFNIWHSKDIKAAVEAAADLKDVAVMVDILTVLILRPSIWNLDLCVTLLPPILELLQSRYEAHMLVGCEALRLILKSFATVIKTNIESPIQTVGVDISREERYNKSLECYKHLVNIRAFALKRQTLQGKPGHAFRELHILLSALD